MGWIIPDCLAKSEWWHSKQLALSKDGASNCLYFLNAAYSDPAFTSAEDEADPMVIVKLDISNAFGSLCARLVSQARLRVITHVALKLMKTLKQPYMD